MVDEEWICVQMLYEIANMLAPKEMQPQKAPAPPAKPMCVITGRPAKYRSGQHLCGHLLSCYHWSTVP